MRFYCLDWGSLILLVCSILLGLACRVGAMGFYLSPLSDMSPATSDCLEPYFSGEFFFFFSNHRVCVDFSESFYFFLISVPFLGS